MPYVKNEKGEWVWVKDSVKVDATLTKRGAAADAKATGEKIDKLSGTIANKVSLPKNEDGTVNHGTVGYYAVSDGAGGIKWVASGNTGGGTDTPVTPTTHGVVWDLANVTSSNLITSVSDGASLTAVLTAATGYTLGDVTITMGGGVLTGVWNADTATISITSVTGDVIISCAGVVQSTEEAVEVSWSNGQWGLNTETGEIALNTEIYTRAATQSIIDATDGYLKIRFNRQDAYNEYMSNAETDCPIIVVYTLDGTMVVPTSRLSNLNADELFTAQGSSVWLKLEWDTDYFLPSGHTYGINLCKSTSQVVVFDEDGLSCSKYGTSVALGSSNANLKAIVAMDGFCTIIKISGGATTVTQTAELIDGQYTQSYTVSATSLTPEDVESEPTTYSGFLKKAIQEWMVEYKGNTKKIPIIVHTDQHGRFDSTTKPVFTTIGNLVPWYDVSKIMNLGDCVSDRWIDADTSNPLLKCTALETMMDCLENIPVSKRLDVFGNHDTWYTDADGNDAVISEQARLSQYFRKIFARNPNGNQSGYYVDYDNVYNVKYVVISCFEYTTSRSTYRIGTEQMAWLINEIGKNDGYDVVIVSHVPLYYVTDEMVFPTGYESTATEDYRVSNVDTDALFAARKNKTSGTVTDSDGIEHTYDFSGCKNDVLCAIHGHTHHDAYTYVGDALLSNAFDWFDGNTVFFALIDRENRRLNVWKVDDTPQYMNYQIPFDKPTE